MNDLEIVDNLPQPAERSVAIESEKAAAVARIQAEFISAKRFPRNEQEALTKIRRSCQRISLAEVALYSFPRGGKPVTGPSIRLAEMLAQSWGNLVFGIRELEHQDGLNGKSVIESYCSDLETNTHQRREFTVFHKRKAGDRIRYLDDPRDVYEHVANYGARRMRAAILGIIPRDIIDQAVAQIQETLKKGNGEPLIDRVNRMVVAFAEFGVSVEMIEKRLKHSAKDISADELVELRSIYTAMKDGESKRGDWFELGSEPQGGKAELLKERAKNLKSEEKK